MKKQQVRKNVENNCLSNHKVISVKSLTKIIKHGIERKSEADARSRGGSIRVHCTPKRLVHDTMQRVSPEICKLSRVGGGVYARAARSGGETEKAPSILGREAHCSDTQYVYVHVYTACAAPLMKIRESKK